MNGFHWVECPRGLPGAGRFCERAERVMLEPKDFHDICDLGFGIWEQGDCRLMIANLKRR